MKVFISWSGEYSKQVALLLQDKLPNMLQALNLFVSEHIESGSKWVVRLSQELESTNFGIFCLAPDNLSSEWLLYEAGALSKNFNGRVCGLLIGDLTKGQIEGPLAQFQHKLFLREEVLALVRDINTLQTPPLDLKRVDTIFDMWWPTIETAYRAIPTTLMAPAPPKRATGDILEELVGRIRSLESALTTAPMVVPAQHVYTRLDSYIIDSGREDVEIVLLGARLIVAGHTAEAEQLIAKLTPSRRHSKNLFIQTGERPRMSLGMATINYFPVHSMEAIA